MFAKPDLQDGGMGPGAKPVTFDRLMEYREGREPLTPQVAGREEPLARDTLSKYKTWRRGSVHSGGRPAWAAVHVTHAGINGMQRGIVTRSRKYIADFKIREEFL
jgi:hypothetical protein